MSQEGKNEILPVFITAQRANTRKISLKYLI